ncbi:hypothetical protein [Hymenobacter elongatus]|uniref:Uncharacterized protein n=1 Tax=Hymenobacter elongatus TaxID=877208 RepID=A0A4Z0PLB6_9BACT|nr:hypothetical protein [Hymenobacter elongatus]TGE16991.1 hypothetical protein E5J99_08365 [Hymenobacter elongatus]
MNASQRLPVVSQPQLALVAPGSGSVDSARQRLRGRLLLTAARVRQALLLPQTMLALWARSRQAPPTASIVPLPAAPRQARPKPGPTGEMRCNPFFDPLSFSSL